MRISKIKLKNKYRFGERFIAHECHLIGDFKIVDWRLED